MSHHNIVVTIVATVADVKPLIDQIDLAIDQLDSIYHFDSAEVMYTEAQPSSNHPPKNGFQTW